MEAEYNVWTNLDDSSHTVIIIPKARGLPGYHPLCRSVTLS